MADYLSEEIVVDILQRLQVKTLLRCTSVSKSWYSLITSRRFISSHLNFTLASGNDLSLLLLRRCIGDSECYSLHFDGENIAWHSSLGFPFRSVNPFYTIIGSCNGLICLSDDRVFYTHNIIVWNPVLRKSIILAKPKLIYNSHGTFVQSFGFGFDPISCDYKLIRIAYVGDVRDPPNIQICRLNTGLWQDISYLALDCVVHNRSHQAYIKGATHWIARDIDGLNLIVSFDMRGEVFRKTMMPPCLANLDSCSSSMNLVVYRESLGVIASGMSGANPALCLWLMKEYGQADSWMKHFSIHFHDLMGGIVRPLCVRTNGEILVVRKDGHIVSYNPNGGEFKNLGLQGSRSEDYIRSVHGDGFRETLALLGKGCNFGDDRINCGMLSTPMGDGCTSGRGYGNHSDVKHYRGKLCTS